MVVWDDPVSETRDVKKVVKWYKKLKQLNLFPKEDKQMALKRKIKKGVAKATPAVVKRGPGRPVAVSTNDNEPIKAGPPAGTKPMTIFMPKKLHARLKLGANALGVSLSDIFRDEGKKWLMSNSKKITAALDFGADDYDEDEEETEDVEEAEDEDTEEEDESEDEEDEE